MRLNYLKDRTDKEAVISNVTLANCKKLFRITEIKYYGPFTINISYRSKILIQDSGNKTQLNM